MPRQREGPDSYPDEVLGDPGQELYVGEFLRVAVNHTREPLGLPQPGGNFAHQDHELRTVVGREEEGVAGSLR